MSNAELAGLSAWSACTEFDAKDRAVLAFTDALSENNAVADDIYGELCAHFSQPEIVKLAFAVGLAGMVNRIHATFQTEVDGPTVEQSSGTPFCVVPQR